MTNPTHPLGSMGATIETALAGSMPAWWQTPPRLDLAAAAVVSAFAEEAKQLLASGDGDGLVAVPSEWNCSHGTTDDEPFCQELDQDEHPECPTIRVHADDAARFAVMVDMVNELRSRLTATELLVERARDKGNTRIDTDALVDALGLDEGG
ncbi:hypothetical protein, partial [Streptomyces himastatinicus]|uniref:hypothetical protein n=1 Tax=Streptomyces himastatinicus TaxID=998084 RepID=UPI0001B4F4F4